MIDLFDYETLGAKIETNIHFFKLLQIHSKKRSRLEHQKLRLGFNSHDAIDLIALNDIDESNEWLLGELEEEENDFVFEEEV